MTNDGIMIKNVRVSFPHLFTRPVINGKEGSFGALLVLDPVNHATHIDAVERQIAALFKENFKGRKLPTDKLCLRDGEDKGRPEYDGLKVLSANSKKKPIVLDSSGQGTIGSAEDSPIYAGCRVNAKIRLWAQDSKSYGKRINATLLAIQFAGHDEPWDASHIIAEEAMEGFDSTDDDYLAA